MQALYPVRIRIWECWILWHGGRKTGQPEENPGNATSLSFAQRLLVVEFLLRNKVFNSSRKLHSSFKPF